MQLLKKYPIYRKILANNFVSGLGDSMYYIALMTYAAQLPKPEIGIMLISLSENIPYLLSVITGSMADLSRHRTKKIMQIGMIRGLLYLGVAVLIGFKPTFMVLSGITLINFVSDMFGKFSGGLWAPFIPYIVKNEDLEEAQGLSGAMGQLIGIIAQFFGAFLLGIFSYRLLAVVNSFAFLLTILIISSIAKKLDKIEEKQLKREKKPLRIKEIGKQVKESMGVLYENKHLFKLLVLFSFANGFLSVLLPLTSLILVEHPEMSRWSFSFSLAMVNGGIASGAIIGSLFGTVIFKKINLNKLCGLIFLSIIIFSGGAFIQSFLCVLIFSIVIGVLIGGGSPKLSALFIKEMPVDRLGAVNGGSSTILMAMPIMTVALFTGIASATSVSVALIVLLIASSLTLVASLIIK